MNNTPLRTPQDQSIRPLALLPSNLFVPSSNHRSSRQPHHRAYLPHPYKFPSSASHFLDHLKASSPSTSTESPSSSKIPSRKHGSSRSASSSTPSSSSSASSSSSPSSSLPLASASTATTIPNSPRLDNRDVRTEPNNYTPRKPERTEAMPHSMAAMGMSPLMASTNPILPGLSLVSAASSPFAVLKMGALSSSQIPTLPSPSGLARSTAAASGASFPSGRLPAASGRSNLPPPAATLPPNMAALFPSPLDPPPSLLPMSPLLQYPAVLATSLSPEEQQYLRMAQLQAEANSKGVAAGPAAGGSFKAPPYTSRNYLELAMLVCNTFRGKLFPCPHCRYVTDRRNNLKRHVATMHQACDKQLECCGVTFATKASLREHIAIFHHNGYSCAFCGRRFCRKALLKRHLSVHNGQKDYTCPHCDYATSHKSNLERHKRIHARIGAVGESSSYPEDDERVDDVDNDGRRRFLVDPHDDPGFVGRSDPFDDVKNNNNNNNNNNNIDCFQSGSPISSFQITNRAISDSENLNSMRMSRCLDRRSVTAFPCSDSELSRLGMRANSLNLSMTDKKDSIFGSAQDGEELDLESDSDIDIDGMEDSEFNDTDEDSKVPTRGSSTVMSSMTCDPDDVHPLNLVKIKVKAD